MSARNVVPQRNVATRPSESVHLVQFYDEDAFLIESVGRFAAPTLTAGGSAVVVATAPHRESLAEELRIRGLDPESHAREGRYVALDAAETLNQFMVEGWPDEALFRETIGRTMSRARTAAMDGSPVSAFGEMVALLWADRKHEAAVRLEQLWNGLGRTHSFSLFCAYPMSGFNRQEHRKLFFNICGEHSHVNAAEGYPAQGSEKQRRRSVAKLQQKASALENEIRLSQERLLLLQKAMQAGTWEMDLLDETIAFSSRAAGMLGLPAGTIGVRQLIDLLPYSGDRESFLAALKRAAKGRKEFVAEFRIGRDRQSCVFSIRGKTVYNNGQPLVLGVLCDVTPTLHRSKGGAASTRGSQATATARSDL